MAVCGTTHAAGSPSQAASFKPNSEQHQSRLRILNGDLCGTQKLAARDSNMLAKGNAAGSSLDGTAYTDVSFGLRLARHRHDVFNEGLGRKVLANGVTRLLQRSLR